MTEHSQPEPEPRPMDGFDVRCPSCGAAPGAACLWSAGWSRQLHPSRQEQAAAQRDAAGSDTAP